MARILVNGCFDGLHEGHVKLLEAASQLGQVYVGLNTDRSALELKGIGRPFIRYYERAKAIRNIIDVEFLFGIDDENMLLGVIQNYKIDFILKGADTLHDKKYKRITGQELVKAVLYVDHGNLSTHSTDLGPIGARGQK